MKSLARRELAATARDLAAAEAGAIVHGVRKRLKFARSLLRLVRQAIGRDAFLAADRPLRDAAKFLATARHAEALQEAIARLGAARNAEEEAALEAIKAISAAAHAADHAPEAVRQATHHAAGHVRMVHAAAASWDLPRHGAGFLLDGLEAAYARARRMIRKGLVAGDVEILHEARKSVIHHLHHLEMLEGLWPGLIRAWTAELTALREALGDLHDLDELAAAVSRHGGIPGEAARQGLAALTSARRETLLGRVNQLSGHLFAEKPAALRRRMAAMWRNSRD